MRNTQPHITSRIRSKPKATRKLVTALTDVTIAVALALVLVRKTSGVINQATQFTPTEIDIDCINRATTTTYWPFDVNGNPLHDCPPTSTSLKKNPRIVLLIIKPAIPVSSHLGSFPFIPRFEVNATKYQANHESRTV